MENPNNSFKREVYSVLDVSDTHSLFSKILNIFLIILICLNVISVCLETVEPLYEEYKTTFYIFELLSVIAFSTEFLLRVWAITCNDKYKHPVFGRIRFLFTPGALVDIIAILPFYLPLLFAGLDLRAIRILRLFRLARILKVSRYMHATTMVGNVFKKKRGELVTVIMLIGFIMIVVSSIMYNVEHGAQPDKFSSIPETMWWSIATLTSADFGDMHPITVIGKTLASLISLLGIGIVALPAGILASGFSEELKRRKENNGVICSCTCPNCGTKIEN